MSVLLMHAPVRGCYNRLVIVLLFTYPAVSRWVKALNKDVDNNPPDTTPISRRSFLYCLALSNGLISPLARSAQLFEKTFTPEQFGASGNGVTSDGAAFHRMISAVNEFSGSMECNIRCQNKYVITGGPRLARSFNQSFVKGVIEGIPPITRDDVSVDARGAEFIVPADFRWQRTRRGGDENDHFAVGWQFMGANCKMIGGRLLGNLDRRKVVRGPKPSGFGGREFGLVVQGEGWELIDVFAENWGTDCLLIGAPGRSVDGVYKGARRNCVSVVPLMEFTRDSYASIEGGQITDGGNWPEDIRNNPGAGIDIEGTKKELHGIVTIKGVEFSGNEKKDLQISTGALNCVIENCTFRNNVKIQPKQNGGHHFNNNKFLGEARVDTMYGLSANAPIVFTGNDFEVSKYRPFRHNVIKGISREEQGQKVIFMNNRAMNWTGRFSDIPLFRDGNVFDKNMTRSDAPTTIP